MDSITQFFVSNYNDVLNIGFIANLLVFSAFMQGMSSIINSFRQLQG